MGLEPYGPTDIGLARDADRRTWPAEERERWEVIEQRATEVFGDAIAASVWMRQRWPRIGKGSAPAGDLCRTAKGFTEALDELARRRRKMPR